MYDFIIVDFYLFSSISPQSPTTYPGTLLISMNFLKMLSRCKDLDRTVHVAAFHKDKPQDEVIIFRVVHWRLCADTVDASSC